MRPQSPRPPGFTLQSPRPPGFTLQSPRPPGFTLQSPRPPGFTLQSPRPPGFTLQSPRPPGFTLQSPRPPGFTLQSPKGLFSRRGSLFSKSLLGSARRTSMGCQADIRIRACLIPSVGDSGPEPDPHVFGPLGSRSGFISQR